MVGDRDPTVNSIMREEVQHVVKTAQRNSNAISALTQSIKDQRYEMQRLREAIERNRETCTNCAARAGWSALQNDVITLENKMDDLMIRKGRPTTSYYPTTKKNGKTSFFKTSSERLRIIAYIIVGAAAITGVVIELIKQNVFQ